MKLFKNWSLKKHIVFSLFISLLVGMLIFLNMKLSGAYLIGIGSSSSHGGFSISLTISKYSALLVAGVFSILVILYKPMDILINKFVQKN